MADISDDRRTQQLLRSLMDYKPDFPYAPLPPAPEDLVKTLGIGQPPLDPADWLTPLIDKAKAKTPGESQYRQDTRAAQTYNPQYNINNVPSVQGGGNRANGIWGGGGRLTAGIPLTDNLSLTGLLSGGGALGTTPDGYKVRVASPDDGFFGLRYGIPF